MRFAENCLVTFPDLFCKIPQAWGILQNRSGKVTRQFSANLNGNWDGKQLILDEKFNWSDGEIQNRQWQITKIDDHNYEGTAVPS